MHLYGFVLFLFCSVKDSDVSFILLTFGLLFSKSNQDHKEKRSNVTVKSSGTVSCVENYIRPV